MLFGAMTPHGWEPGPGDPSVLGWLVFIGYLSVSVLAWRAARQDSARGLDPLLWRVLATASVLLAVNKQLDLHNAVASMGRSLAQSEGWYAHRRPIQLAFATSVCIAGLAVIGAVLRHTHPQWQRHRLTLIGMVLLVAFVVIRTASFHYLDTFFGMEWDCWRVPSLLEVAGLAFLILATRQAARHPAARKAQT